MFNRYRQLKMKRILPIVLLFWATFSYGQENVKIYKGQKLPFNITYLTISDDKTEIEQFYRKGSQIFAHTRAKELKMGMNSHRSAPIFKSSDDSVKVYYKKDYYLVEQKGIGKIKVYLTNETKEEIITLRNRNRLFEFTQSLTEELRKHPNFDIHQINEQINAYNLKDYVSQSQRDFENLLTKVNKEVKENWR
jgi:hypothetical protein